MKILTTLYQVNHMEELSLADGFLLGNEQFGTRLTHSFSTEEINLAIDKAQALNKEIYLVANQMFTDDMIKSFRLWLKELNVDGLTGIILADVGSYYAMQKDGLGSKLIYNPETLMTNHYDFNFLVKTGIYGVFIAKEITLEDIKIISNKKQSHLFMVGHGHLNMFYSKRQLINNYMDFIQEENTLHNKQSIVLIEEKRSEEPYPVLEDLAGTHVFRSQVFDSLEYIEQLKPYVDYLVIDTIFKDDAYAKQIIDLYHGIGLDKKEEIQKAYNEKWDNGFFFKKTTYKQGGGH